jgi:hypothetical protein
VIDRVRETFVSIIMLNCLEKDNLFLDKTVFSDEATIHLSGKVDQHHLIT